MRDVTLRDAKATLRQWFAQQSVDYLTKVVDECRVGVFQYSETCHCLRGLCVGGYYGEAGTHPLALEAEDALLELKWRGCRELEQVGRSQEEITRVRTLPIVLAEIRRRQQFASQEAEREALAGVEIVQ